MLKVFIEFFLDGITIIPLKLYENKITCDYQKEVCQIGDNESLIVPKWQYETQKMKIYVKGIEKVSQVIDDFESYADTSALKSIWRTNSTFVNLELIGVSGAKMMKMKLKKSVSKDSVIYRSYVLAVDWSNFDGIKMRFLQSDFESSFSFYIYDGRVKLIRTIDLENEMDFEDVYMWFSEFQQVGTGNFDFSNIREIGFIVTKSVQNTYAYVDNIVLLNKIGNLTISLGSYDPANNTFASVKERKYNLEVGVNVFEIDASDLGYENWNSIRVFKEAGGVDCSFYGQTLDPDVSSGIYKISADNVPTEVKALIHYEYFVPVVTSKLKKMILYPDTEFKYDIVRIKRYQPEATSYEVVFEDLMRGAEYMVDLSNKFLGGHLYLEIERKSGVKRVTGIIEFEKEI
jgi:hypothetical protein